MAARLGSPSAVLQFVLLALCVTGIADLRAEAADVVGEVSAPTHVGRGRPTDLRAVVVQANTLGQRLDLRLVQAGVGAVLASLRTAGTRYETRLVLLVSHEHSPRR